MKKPITVLDFFEVFEIAIQKDTRKNDEFKIINLKLKNRCFMVEIVEDARTL